MHLLVNLESNSLRTTYHLLIMNSHLQKYCFSFFWNKNLIPTRRNISPYNFSRYNMASVEVISHNFKTCTNFNHQMESPKNNSLSFQNFSTTLLDECFHEAPKIVFKCRSSDQWYSKGHGPCKLHPQTQILNPTKEDMASRRAIKYAQNTVKICSCEWYSPVPTSDNIGGQRF